MNKRHGIQWDYRGLEQLEHGDKGRQADRWTDREQEELMSFDTVTAAEQVLQDSFETWISDVVNASIFPVLLKFLIEPVTFDDDDMHKKQIQQWIPLKM